MNRTQRRVPYLRVVKGADVRRAPAAGARGELPRRVVVAAIAIPPSRCFADADPAKRFILSTCGAASAPTEEFAG